MQAVGFEFIRVRPTLTRNMSNLTMDLDFVFERAINFLLNGLIYLEIPQLWIELLRRQFFIIEGDPFNPREIKAAEDRIRIRSFF